MLTFRGQEVTRLIVIVEVCGKDDDAKAVLKKLYFGEDGEIGIRESNPRPDRITDLVGHQHDLLARAGYIIEEENERTSVNGENHWSLERFYRFVKHTPATT